MYNETVGEITRLIEATRANSDRFTPPAVAAAIEGLQQFLIMLDRIQRNLCEAAELNESTEGCDPRSKPAVEFVNVATLTLIVSTDRMLFLAYCMAELARLFDESAQLQDTPEEHDRVAGLANHARRIRGMLVAMHGALQGNVVN